MRLDKYLKVSKILKRRAVAATACKSGKVEINTRSAKPGAQLKVGDIVTINFASGVLRFEVLCVDMPNKSNPIMYKVIEETL